MKNTLWETFWSKHLMYRSKGMIGKKNGLISSITFVEQQRWQSTNWLYSFLFGLFFHLGMSETGNRGWWVWMRIYTGTDTGCFSRLTAPFAEAFANLRPSCSRASHKDSAIASTVYCNSKLKKAHKVCQDSFPWLWMLWPAENVSLSCRSYTGTNRAVGCLSLPQWELRHFRREGRSESERSFRHFH